MQIIRFESDNNKVYTGFDFPKHLVVYFLPGVCYWHGYKISSAIKYQSKGMYKFVSIYSLSTIQIPGFDGLLGT